MFLFLILHLSCLQGAFSSGMVRRAASQLAGRLARCLQTPEAALASVFQGGSAAVGAGRACEQVISRRIASHQRFISTWVCCVRLLGGYMCAVCSCELLLMSYSEVSGS